MAALEGHAGVGDFWQPYSHNKRTEEFLQLLVVLRSEEEVRYSL